jgi:putative ABC transport system permease protein
MELRLGRDTTMSAYVQGIDPRAAPKFGWTLQSGQPRLAPGQVVVGSQLFSNSGFLVISPGAAVANNPAASTGPEVQLQGRTLLATLTRYDDQGNKSTRSERLRVAGVFEQSGGVNDVSVYMALSDVETYNQWFTGVRRSARQGYDAATVKVGDPAEVRDVQSAIDAMGFTTFSSQQIAEGLGQFFLIVRLVLGGIGAVALLVAAFGIANTMTMAIYERTKEIGIMKAVGATNRDVLRIFLGEAGAIGALGGVFGVLLGWGGGKGVNLALQVAVLRSQPANQASGQPSPSLLVTPLWLAAFAVAFATLVGLCSGIYPALRAASMKPLRALRTE